MTKVINQRECQNVCDRWRGEKEEECVVQCSRLRELRHKLLEGQIVVPCHGQLVVGVLIEVEVREGGALLVQEKVFENPKLMLVSWKLLLASIVVSLAYQP